MIRNLLIVALLCLIPCMAWADGAKTPQQLRGTGFAIGTQIADKLSVKGLFTQTLSDRWIVLSSGGIDVDGSLVADFGGACMVGWRSYVRTAYDLSKDVGTVLTLDDFYFGAGKYFGFSEKVGALLDFGTWGDSPVVSVGLHFDL